MVLKTVAIPNEIMQAIKNSYPINRVSGLTVQETVAALLRYALEHKPVIIRDPIKPINGDTHETEITANN